jgi:hypothetical protein
MNILKNYDFPVKCRSDKGVVTDNMVKEWFKKHKKTKPAIKYANFFFLIYLAKILELESAEVYAKQINEEQLDHELLEELLSSLLGYF